VKDRGIDAVIDDLASAIAWAPDLEWARGFHRVLDREQLRGGAELFQQLHHSAFNMGMRDLARVSCNR
jgi:hypothetical protein